VELRKKGQELMSASKAIRKSVSGFTLAEVTIAILVLSSAVIVMISLQSASVDSAFRDERRQKALLAARAIFAALEIQEDPPEDIDVQSPLVDLLSKREPLNALTDWGDRQELKPFQAHLSIKNWPLPLKDIRNDAIKQVLLRVYWSDSPADAIELVYFIPKGAS
jgi:type II secretory pathway pseudopilin PulG